MHCRLRSSHRCAGAGPFRKPDACACSSALALSTEWQRRSERHTRNAAYPSARQCTMGDRFLPGTSRCPAAGGGVEASGRASAAVHLSERRGGCAPPSRPRPRRQQGRAAGGCSAAARRDPAHIPTSTPAQLTTILARCLAVSLPPDTPPCATHHHGHQAHPAHRGGTGAGPDCLAGVLGTCPRRRTCPRTLQQLKCTSPRTTHRTRPTPKTRCVQGWHCSVHVQCACDLRWGRSGRLVGALAWRGSHPGRSGLGDLAFHLHLNHSPPSQRQPVPRRQKLRCLHT